MSNKFIIHRKRPDLINITLDLDRHNFSEGEGEGEGEMESQGLVPVEIFFHRPNTPQQLNLSSTLMSMRRGLNPNQDSLGFEEYAAGAVSLLTLVHSVTGLFDEDGQALEWSDLSHTEKEGFMLSLPVGSVMDAIVDLSLAGRLTGAKKKPSVTTSTPSTTTATVDAPPAPTPE